MLANIKDRLDLLRAEMVRAGVDAYIILRENEFRGEYVPACHERLAWVSGFTGSAGLAMVLADRALIMSDGRYDEQMKIETDPALFERKVARLPLAAAQWAADALHKGAVIGYDPRIMTATDVDTLSTFFDNKGMAFRPVDGNLVDRVWAGRPPAPQAPVRVFPDAIAGRTAEEKRNLIADTINRAGATAAILTEGDSIAWLLNIRGDDVPHTPFALSYAIIHANEDVDWFIDPVKVSAATVAHLGNRVQVHDIATLQDGMRALAQKAVSEGRGVLFDPARSPVWFRNALQDAHAPVIEGDDPCIAPKACKTDAEINRIREAHVQDGVAVTKFLYWLDHHDHAAQPLTELDIADRLLAFRKSVNDFADTSFDTIAGWAANGAIIHYRATPQRHSTITPPGILLLDSGGQYLGATTDITRTIPIGAQIIPDVKEAFTRVLMGHIDLASAKFRAGLAGRHLDVLARRALWDVGLDYEHGTGHGVGAGLSVHEDGCGFSVMAQDVLKENMVISNEPGFYKPGAFGIRIENLVRVMRVGTVLNQDLLGFETLTLVPIDRRLIDFNLLARNRDHVDWLDAYHARVEAALAPYLNADERDWLREMTKPLAQGDPIVKKPNATARHMPWPWPVQKGP